ncbi:MAG: hypothetical protein ACFFDF_23285 [Candidatus Odinarchaeota archaeon]
MTSATCAETSSLWPSSSSDYALPTRKLSRRGSVDPPPSSLPTTDPTTGVWCIWFSIWCCWLLQEIKNIFNLIGGLKIGRN